MTTPSLAALYRRVSTDKQDDSLDLQEKRCLHYAQFKALEVPDYLTYSDPDTSGRTPMLDRAGGRALLNRLKHGDVKDLIVAKLDRLGRNVRDALTVLELLKTHGITLHIVDFGGETISTQGHMGRLILTVLLAVAEWEVEEIRDRTRKVLDYKFKRGELIGKVPFGFDCLYTFADGSTLVSPQALSPDDLANHSEVINKQLIDNPAEQAIIRTIFDWRTSGWSLKAIAHQLNALGHRPKLGGQWQCGNVDSVLHSRHTAKVLESLRAA
jgi:DNA invertase Pin-like site-specific DNA recombinase